ncbi:unnamed protein product, partial [Effrenium voratum]
AGMTEIPPELDAIIKEVDSNGSGPVEKLYRRRCVLGCVQGLRQRRIWHDQPRRAGAGSQ